MKERQETAQDCRSSPMPALCSPDEDGEKTTLLPFPSSQGEIPSRKGRKLECLQEKDPWAYDVRTPVR